MNQKEFLIFGDSLFQDLPLFFNYRVESYPGYRAEEFVNDPSMLLSAINLEYLGDKRVKPYHAAALCLGTNDLGWGYSVNDTLVCLHKLVTLIKEHGVKPVLVFKLQKLGDKSGKIDQYNSMLKEQFEHVSDFFCTVAVNGYQHDDGLHLNQEGKEALARHIQEWCLSV